MNDDDSMREQVSALTDGQVQDESLARLIERVCSDDALRDTWRTYHLVGEVLRSGQHSVCADSDLFVARFRQTLSAEAAAPASFAQDVSQAQPAPRIRAEAANEPVFRWKIAAGVASLAAAAAIGWNWIGGVPGQAPAGTQLAQQAPAAVVSGVVTPSTPLVAAGERQQADLMLRDPRLDALLQAHQQAGGASNMPSAFLRNATFEGPSR